MTRFIIIALTLTLTSYAQNTAPETTLHTNYEEFSQDAQIFIDEFYHHYPKEQAEIVSMLPENESEDSHETFFVSHEYDEEGQLRFTRNQPGELAKAYSLIRLLTEDLVRCESNIIERDQLAYIKCDFLEENTLYSLTFSESFNGDNSSLQISSNFQRRDRCDTGRSRRGHNYTRIYQEHSYSKRAEREITLRCFDRARNAPLNLLDISYYSSDDSDSWRTREDTIQACRQYEQDHMGSH
jgi:hypothetical protein